MSTGKLSVINGEQSNRNAYVREARETICEYGMQLLKDDLTKSTGGNLSVRIRGENGKFVISPSGIPYPEMEPSDVPVVDRDGNMIGSGEKPASETPMHLAIFNHIEGVGGVVHTHSPYACTFASLGQPIPASHYLIAFIGNEIPVSDYVTYGTPDLGEEAVSTLGGEYNACLLRNHGVIAVGSSLSEAYEIALMVEFCARIHYQAKSIGEPEILPDDELEELAERFAGYGPSVDSDTPCPTC